MKSIIFKFLIISSFAAILSSCASTQLTNREEEVKIFAIDFREYADKGFLFMPDEYFGEYEVKGLITAELHPEVIYREGRVSTPIPGYVLTVLYFADKTYTKVIKNVEIDELIEYIYNLAIEWGGDAFTNFKSSMEVGKTDDNLNSIYTYYSISGIVIKRK